MEFNITKQMVVTALSFLGLGSLIGALSQKAYDNYNTPEEKVLRMKEEEEVLRLKKIDVEEAVKRSREAAAEARGEQSLVKEERRKLELTKLAYQKEITPNIEAKIRKELQEYISKADSTYEKAKQLRKEVEHEKELANLKLELAKTLKENLTTTEKEVKIIYKNADDEEEETE